MAEQNDSGNGKVTLALIAQKLDGIEERLKHLDDLRDFCAVQKGVNDGIHRQLWDNGKSRIQSTEDAVKSLAAWNKVLLVPMLLLLISQAMRWIAP
jgi:hypothetical protein